MKLRYQLIIIYICFTNFDVRRINVSGEDENACEIGGETCEGSVSGENKYHKDANLKWTKYLNNVKAAFDNYEPCTTSNCSCFTSLITSDLQTWEDGISRQLIEESKLLGTHYQIINHTLYREEDCMFPFRCSGVEHFLLELLPDLSDTEFILNTRDWPQVPKYRNALPVFSFSKTDQFWDIIYPAWTFWEGGPAIGLYPTGLGRWNEHRISITRASKKWPWDQKKSMGFFRGSRTSSERDPLILLSRKNFALVDAQYTKNQAWKSESDTLYASPAEEVSLEDHCQYKYLFNFRGVAASFRFKHLFLCRSLVFHVGDEWIEFFYPALKPWIHYIPIDAGITEEKILDLLHFAQDNEETVKEIADRGYDFIWEHLHMEDISCYWKHLLQQYGKLLNFKPTLGPQMKRIKPKK